VFVIQHRCSTSYCELCILLLIKYFDCALFFGSFFLTGKHICLHVYYTKYRAVRWTIFAFYVRLTHILRTCIGNSFLFERVPSEI
jgi:hypothetical protein